MSILENLVELGRIVDTMTEAEQKTFSQGVGQALGVVIKNTATKVDDFAATEVLFPNLRTIIDRAESVINSEGTE